MFKKFGIIAIIAVIIPCFFMLTCGADSNSEVLVNINSISVKMDIQPRIVNGEVFVPVRETLNLFGMKVEWDKSSRTAIATKENKVIGIKAESNKVLIDGENIDFKFSSFIYNDRLFISPEIFRYGFGMAFSFDSENNTLNVWSTDKNDILINGSDNILIKDCIDSIINITRRYKPDKLGDEIESANKLYDDKKYIEAIKSYEEILKSISSKENPEEYGYINLSIGNAYLALAQEADTEKNAVNAIAAYKQASTVDSRKIQASASYGLGQAYNVLARIRNSDANSKLALEYLEDALKIYKLEDYPLEYARIQLQKVTSYINQNAHNGNTESLYNSIGIIEEVLSIFEEEEYMIGYAMAQNNLGKCYFNLSYAENTKENLYKSIEAYENALKNLNEEEYPYEYCNIRGSLGACYINLSVIDKNIQYVKKAIQNFEEQLKMSAFDKFPVRYASSNFNLGLAYANLSEFEDLEQNILKSIEFYKNSLKIRNVSETPIYYTYAIQGMGIQYLRLAYIKDSEENILKSIDLLNEALKIFTDDKYSLDYAYTCRYLGLAYNRLSSIKNREENLNEAIKLFEEAIEICKMKNEMHTAALTNILLGEAYYLLALIEEPEKNLSKAYSAYMEAQEIITLDEVMYADILESLGNILIFKAELGDGEENLGEAYGFFEKYLMIYGNMMQIDENYEAKYHKGEYYKGKVYHALSQIMDKEVNLNKAIELYEKFLEVYTTAEHDLGYANVRVSLGKAYAELLEAGREEYFDKALESFEEALKIISIDNSFYDYAIILAEQAKAYTKMGEIKASRGILKKPLKKLWQL